MATYCPDYSEEGENLSQQLSELHKKRLAQDHNEIADALRARSSPVGVYMLHADSELQQLTITDLQNRLDQEHLASLNFQQQFLQTSKEMHKLSTQSTRNQMSITSRQQENSAIRNEFDNLRREIWQQQ